MPIGTPHGTLDYKQVSKVTFVGASSNTVIDTTTGSLGVGVDGNGPTSNLHVVGHTRLEGDINMLHTANTASIKLNSNVVTEFPRSKKLIKYPRVALTANSSGGYVASANSEYHNDHAAFRAFNNKGPGYDYGATIGWEPANISTFNSSGTWVGSTSSSANTTITLEGGNTIYGEWLQIQLPTKIRLEYVNFLPLKNTSHAMAHRAPRAGYILGSNNGTNWTALKYWSGIVYETWTAYYHKFYKFDIDKEVDNYQYFRFVWTETAGTSTLSEYASGQELEFWGVPEYDPEAAGVDIKMTSYPNVPNTDWLKVYYDAKDLDNGAVTTVDDLTPSGTNDGTAYGGVTASDGSFVLDGTNDYITTPALGFSGDQAHSVSLWFWSDKLQTDMTTEHGIYGIGYANNLHAGLSWWSPVTVPGSSLRFWHDGSGGKNFPGVTFLEGKWNHIVLVYIGNGAWNSRVWLNGVELKGVNGTGSGGNNYDFNWSTGDTMIIGDWYTSSGPRLQSPWDGKIANFRLFNRALTSDEIYQLYAYQKEYFGHGDLSMTLKAGRLGIGTSEPRAVLDVKGDTFSRVYKGGRTTFLTWDYEGQRYVDISPPANNNSYANVANILDHTFDIPSCYHDLGRATLKAFVQIDWRGEVNRPWNFVFRIEVHYNGNQIAYSSSSDHAASYNNRGCGIPTVGYHNDHDSTPEAASVTSLFKLTDCDVSPGSTLKVQLVGQWGDISQLTQRVWTGRTAGNQNRPDFELPTSSFFVVLDVDDGY